MADRPESIAADLQRLLNRHGHGFQYAVLKACDGLQVLSSPIGTWRIRAAEVPVELNGKEFHIDGVLEYFSENAPFHTLAVIETKKADPAYSRWCFAARSDRSDPPMTDLFTVREVDVLGGELNPLWANSATLDPYGAEVADLAIELRNRSATGNELGKTFDLALTQVLRGVGGLAEQLVPWNLSPRWTRIAPVIVTTADLFWTRTALDSADLQTGDLSGIELEPRDYVWLQAVASRSLLPDARRQFQRQPATSNPIAFHRTHEHSRAVMVTTTRGLKEALATVALQAVYLV